VGLVAPRAGAWIETIIRDYNALFFLVAPRAGAWIETQQTIDKIGLHVVAPRAGAWIETIFLNHVRLHLLVAPRAGAWIETSLYLLMPILPCCRPPCGGVD